MAVTSEQLEKLKEEIPFKWREQSVNQYGATMVAYIDARQLFDQLDKVCGVGNWQTDFKLVDGKLYGGIGILVDQGSSDGISVKPEWVWKWDVGAESNVEKEKGESSDALKRAGVQFGVGRFLYSLGIVKLKSAQYDGKYKPADDSGNILWDKDKLSALCNLAVKEGKLDRTKIYQTATKEQTKVNAQTKPYLNKGTENFDKVVAALKSKKATIAQVLTKYRLSAEVKKELEALVVA